MDGWKEGGKRGSKEEEEKKSHGHHIQQTRWKGIHMSSQLQTDEDKPPIVKKKKKKIGKVLAFVWRVNREKTWDIYETSEKESPNIQQMFTIKSGLGPF